MFRKSIECLNNLLQSNMIDGYVIIKTIDDFIFVGNDIDILVSPQDFQRILEESLKDHTQFGIHGIRYNTKKDRGKMDIFIQDGLGIDVHSYIGWGNVIFFNFSVETYTEQSEIFGIKCKVINKKVNSVIILAHIFERGFLTMDEAIFLNQHFDEQYLREEFPQLSEMLNEHLKWILSILKEPGKEFPVFLPLWTFVKCYLKLSAPDKLENIKTFTRDFSLVTFWRVRYHLLRRLPFEINLDLK